MEQLKTGAVRGTGSRPCQWAQDDQLMIPG